MSKTVPEDSKNVKHLEWLMDMQKNEAQLHWTRNNYFTVTSSILLLALSQFKAQALGVIISLVGVFFSFAWLAIQDRSNRYIAYYKAKVQELDTSDHVVFPPKLGGFQMRHVAFVLPLVFLFMWLVILAAVVAGVSI